MALTFTVADSSFEAGDTIAGSDIVSRFDDVATKFNAGIVNADVSTTAAISIDKIDANIEHMLVTFHVGNVGATDFVWPAVGTVVRAFPIPDDGKGNWTISAGEMVCSDVGADDSQVRFEWGRYVTGTWTVTSTMVTAVAINSDDSAANTSGHQTLTLAATALAAGTHRCLAMVSGAAGTTATFDTADSFLSASFHLYRKVANG